MRYVRNFEPWFVAGRDSVPWHDVRLRGYGQNKIIQVRAGQGRGLASKGLQAPAGWPRTPSSHMDIHAYAEHGKDSRITHACM